MCGTVLTFSIIEQDVLSYGDRAIAVEVLLRSMAIVNRERTSAQIVMYAYIS